MRRLAPLLPFLILVATAPPARAASSSTDADHLHVQLVLPQAELYPQGLNHGGLDFKLEPGWHIYWQNAGDSGEPPAVRWILPEGVTADPLQFPAPARLPLGPLMDFGYNNEVVFPMSFRVDPSVRPGPAILNAHVSWLVCREVCIPGKADLGAPVQLDSSEPGAVTTSAVDLALWKRGMDSLPKPLPVADQARFEPSSTGFRLAVSTGRPETQAVFFPTDQNLVDNPAPQKLTPTPRGLILDLKKDVNLSANPADLAGVIELSGGRDYQISAEPGTVALPAAAGGVALLDLARICGLAFLGGLLLNLMPCVFPVLFLKGLALVNSGSEQRRTLRAHGFVYAAGILVSFWALVGALLGLRSAGASLGWGFQFQSPVFLALMASLLFFLGLALAGQFEIGLSLTSAGGGLAARPGYAGSFLTGVLAVVVATPCTGPFMAAAIGYALAQPAGVTFAVFTALALGLAAPYVALTVQPAWTALLPKPGAWMEVLKQAVSIPIFITVIWLALVLANAYGVVVLAALLSSFLLLAIAGWFLGRWPAQRWSSAVAALLAAAVVTLAIVSPNLEGTTPATAGATLASSGDWQPWSQAAVSRYESEGRPVFVDFTASWCLSCQVNERVALRQPEVEKAFAKANVALLKADWTRHDEAITEALAALGRSGVPAYVLYVPGQSSPRLLPEVLTPGIVTGELARLPQTETRASAQTSYGR
jgi:thiol:disulfide interchange protein/DsbC/DsbD-like thiol-disulfide interchange protein